MEKNKLLKLVCKYLKGESTETESLSILQEIESILKRGDQDLIDFISLRIQSKNPDLMDAWADLSEILCSTINNLTNGVGDEFKAVLFLIPVIVSFEANQECQLDPLDIVKLGVIRNLMINSGLISEEDENIGTLTQLYSLNEITSFNEVTRYQILKKFVAQNRSNLPLSMNTSPEEKVIPNALNIKLRFILGCATLKVQSTESPLSAWIDPMGDADEEQMINDFPLIAHFSKAISQKLPSILKKNPGIKNLKTSVLSIQEMSEFGIKSSIGEYDDFKWTLLLSKAAQNESSKIIIDQLDDQSVIDVSLVQEDRKVLNIQVNSFCESEEELEEYFGEFLEDLESLGFELCPGNGGAAVFARKVKEERRSSRKGNLRLLH